MMKRNEVLSYGNLGKELGRMQLASLCLWALYHISYR